MKNVYRVSTEQHGKMKSSVSRSKNATILQARCAIAQFCSNMWNSNYPHTPQKRAKRSHLRVCGAHRHVNAIALHAFVAATAKLQKFVISEPNFSPSEQGGDRQHQLRQTTRCLLACLSSRVASAIRVHGYDATELDNW